MQEDAHSESGGPSSCIRIPPDSLLEAFWKKLSLLIGKELSCYLAFQNARYDSKNSLGRRVYSKIHLKESCFTNAIYIIFKDQIYSTVLMNSFQAFS